MSTPAKSMSNTPTPRCKSQSVMMPTADNATAMVARMANSVVELRSRQRGSILPALSAP
jgi:hypothetical protein